MGSGRRVIKEFDILGMKEGQVQALIRAHAAEKNIPQRVKPDIMYNSRKSVVRAVWIWVED